MVEKLKSKKIIAALFIFALGTGLCVAQQDASESGSGNESGALEPLRTAIREKVIEKLPFQVHGFIDARGGIRTQDDPHMDRTATLGETRLQLNIDWYTRLAQIKLKSDFLYDAVAKDFKPDLREANVLFTPFYFVDVKAGRQILTWGTGDLLFINDLFPKDWQSFFIGRDAEYLKAPSDAIKASFFFDLLNFDVIYTPSFDPDRYIEGDRVSYWNAMLGRLAGEDEDVVADEPNSWFHDDETALRIYKNIKGYELALYYYNGFWKSPAGTDPDTGNATFPRLAVYGASARGVVLDGIGNIEFGYYDSKDDTDGYNAYVRNSEFRILAGYERELARNLTGALQYYIEYMEDYDEYRSALPDGMNPSDEDRHVITLRLTQLLMNQNLELSLFTYYSPTDEDAYLRPRVTYKFTDEWTGVVGGNVFLGEDENTFFGQFENNTNVYAGLRWNF